MFQDPRVRGLAPVILGAAALLAGGCWSLHGNKLKEPEKKYLGTKNERPLIIKTNEEEAMRVTAERQVGIGTPSPEAKLHVVDGNVVFDGEDGGAGPVTVTGPGARLMWLQEKGAFRAGTAEGTEWDDANVGVDSIALGKGSDASGGSATAIGLRASARGLGSVALGFDTEAVAQTSAALGTETRSTGVSSMAIGFQSEASGPKAIAIGRKATSSGDTSLALGWDVEAAATGSVVIGRGDATFDLKNTTPNSLSIGFNSNQPTLFVGPSSGAPDTGRVGIGIRSPERELHVRDGVVLVDRAENSAGIILSRTRVSGGGGGTGGPFVNYEPLKTFVLGVNAPASDQPDDGYFFIGDMHAETTGSSDERLRIDRHGQVEIGDTIELNPSGAGNGGTVFLRDGDGDATVVIEAAHQHSGGRILIRDGDGDTNLQLDSNWEDTGESRVVTDVIEITGGSDLAETFEIAGSPRPGMVVSIDSAGNGGLVVASQPYDRRVAGIVSGAGDLRPGLILAAAADGTYPIALTGRAHCLADDSNGEITAGDLLTSSGRVGHCMKVSDYLRAQGAVIGKAMGSARDGLVLVLVSLQ